MAEITKDPFQSVPVESSQSPDRTAILVGSPNFNARGSTGNESMYAPRNNPNHDSALSINSKLYNADRSISQDQNVYNHDLSRHVGSLKDG